MTTLASLETTLRAFNDAVNAGNLANAREIVTLLEARWRLHPRARVAIAELAMFEDRLDFAHCELAAAIEAEPTLAAAWHDLGAVAQWRQDHAKAISCFRRAVTLKSDAGASAVALAHSLFAIGDYEQGWVWFEHRSGGGARRPRPRGFWDGSVIPHAALAVYGEQGYGDIVQFCRYIPQIRERVGRLYLVLDRHQPLVSLLATLPGVDVTVVDRKQGPPIHAYCPIMTLARFAGASLESPGRVPYLSAPSERIRRWREKLGDARALRVGLVWAGNHRNEPRGTAIDARRSIDPALLGPLLAVPNVEWHALQLGYGRDQWNRLPANAAIVDHAPAIRDFGDTAGLIANLDLVVTVDTAVAHVAGAMGKSVFMLNRFDSCWRWGQQGMTTPWYPTMRIFRQSVFGDWVPAIADAASALAAWQHLYG